MREQLIEIQEKINSFYLYDDQIANQYIDLIKEAIEIIRQIDARPTCMLDNAKNEAITELSNELANRMNTKFFYANLERKKSEFRISKMLVTVAIGNVLSSYDIN
ncbi:MAG: hypothetical protein LBQ60_04150 [Bacteroidales bacterium]|jgi:hypothetical protein|nr:hypothetical protein [Bacteroidales bacterium]